MAEMRRCLRCGHEWSQRTGTNPDVPEVPEPYWNRQRRGEEMSPVVELERVLDERRQMEVQLEMRRAQMEGQLASVEEEMSRTKMELVTVERQLDDLRSEKEVDGDRQQDLQRIEARIEDLSVRRSCLENEASKLQQALKTLASDEGAANVEMIDRDLLLEALDDDAGNELYAEGARQYARRLADRIRDGEFD